jgi:hypothetical protein
MATWTTITDAALEPGKPIRSVDGLALRDNSIAIAEGASGAPRIENAAFDAAVLGSEKFQAGTDERDWVLGRTSGAAAGAVGTYAFLNVVGGSATAGDLKAGSDLEYSDSVDDGGSSPSGTWRAMGTAGFTRSTVFLRIS